METSMKNAWRFGALIVAFVVASQTTWAGKPAANKEWAFQPIRMVEPPADPSGWSANPVDRFIRAKLRDHDLQPANPADKRTLIRRVTLDLLGLPPTPEEIDAFVADSSAEAWSKVVERLLASPRYGERWGRHWLDVVRYADTGGFEADHLYPSAWKYRDYVIRSFNADKPFDRFIQEQVAADELWPKDSEAVLGTGLYCVGPALDESAMVSNQLEYEWLTDAADTTGAAFLGLTLGCARCHNHKYDPITQKDYFAMQAIFAASDRPFPEKTRLLRIKILNGLLSDAPVPEKLLNDPRCHVQTEEQIGFRLVHRHEPLEVHRLKRGELSKPLETVGPALPAVLTRGDVAAATDFSVDKPGKRRADLARWLTSPDNPLTARVLVNRIWAWHFGQGIVRTPNDFGSQGEPPTHPELLDWLAREFMDHGWRLKHLHRLILLSNTYQMQSDLSGSRRSSAPSAIKVEQKTAEDAEKRGEKADPENRLLWHWPRRRLEGETIRDSMLACAGTLNTKPFGPPVVPPLGQEELTGLFNAKEKWPVTRDKAEYARRSVYLLVRRTFLYPMFAAFDPPEVMSSCPCRQQTVVPTQALTLLNSPVAHEQARAFANGLRLECNDPPRSDGLQSSPPLRGGTPWEKIIARAWLLAYGRPITPKESGHIVESLRSGEITLEQLCLALFNSNEFVFVE
jgi:hypothetical protein